MINGPARSCRKTNKQLCLIKYCHYIVLTPAKKVDKALVQKILGATFLALFLTNPDYNLSYFRLMEKLSSFSSTLYYSGVYSHWLTPIGLPATPVTKSSAKDGRIYVNPMSRSLHQTLLQLLPRLRLKTQAAYIFTTSSTKTLSFPRLE